MGMGFSTDALAARGERSTGATAPTGHPRRPLRVLHVVTRLSVGGTEYVLSNVVKGLGRGLFDHRICSTRGFDPAFARLPLLEGRLHLAGKPGAGFQFMVPRLARIMRECRADIVHSRNWGAIEAIPAARVAGVPIAIHSEHGYEAETLAGLPGRQRLFRRLIYPLADAVFTVTEDLRTFHAREAWTPADRIRVIHNGVDVERFAPCPEAGREIRRELGLSPEAFVAGTVGRMVAIKDQGILLKAVAELVREGIDAHAVLVGAGPEMARLRSLVDASPELTNRVVLPGVAERIPAFLAAFDVFVLPSLREGMSNTVLEAMASALPVVATRVGGNPDLVEDDVTGWLFPPGDVAGLAAMLRRLAADSGLVRRLGEAGRRRVLEHFTLERMCRDYRNLYLELADRRGILPAECPGPASD
jgi:sugar transferase (PEP-CTERM/EpsH1 system associated)